MGKSKIQGLDRVLYPYVYLHYECIGWEVVSEVVIEAEYPEELSDIEDIINWGWKQGLEKEDNRMKLIRVEVKSPRPPLIRL
jgi:hypothetical protein